MLSLFFVIFGSIGIFLNWPIINKGFFFLLTKPWNEIHLIDALNQYSSGFSRPDGSVIIALSLLLLLTAFMRTSKALLNTRIIVLAVISAIISAELFTVVQLGYSFYHYLGLLYSTIFFLMAFVSAIFRFGSMKSLNSTFMGKPMSESQVFSQTFSQMMGQVARSPVIQITADDDMSEQWAKGAEKKFFASEVKLGRDEQWADVRIGSDWGTVSGRHGIIRIIGNAMIYEPVSGHYAFGVDGKPFTSPKEIPSQSRLSLVSGSGPNLKVAYEFQKKSMVHPRTMLKVGEIARDEFKNLQTTFKILVVMVILGLPLLWWFSAIQKKEMNNYIGQIRKQNHEFTIEIKEKIERINQLDRESQKNGQEISRLKSKINQLNQQDISNSEEIRSSRNRIDFLRKKVNPGRINREIEKIAKIIDINMSSQRISVYFPFFSFTGNEMVKNGTALFIKNKNGKFFIATDMSGVMPEKTSRNATTFFFIYPDSWGTFSEYLSGIQKGKTTIAALRNDLKKNQARYNLMVIEGRTWGPYGSGTGNNTIIMAPVKNLPDYLAPYVPMFGGPASPSDRVIVYGFSSGKKIYLPAQLVNQSGPVVRTRAGSKIRFAGAFLIKVLPDGRYSLIGISHSPQTGTGSRQYHFLSFE